MVVIEGMRNLDTNHFACDYNIEENNCGIESRMLRAQFRFGSAISATFIIPKGKSLFSVISIFQYFYQALY